MNYRIDLKKFKKSLLEAGYKSVLDFSQKTKIHRNTLQGFLAGKNVFISSFVALASHLKKDPLELVATDNSLPSKIQDIHELNEVISCLAKKDKKMALVLLGSRARGNAKQYSDWDLGVFRYPDPLSGREYLKLKREVEEVSENLVRKVDLINLNQAPLWFLRDIKNDVIFLAGLQESFLYLKGMLDGIQKEQAA